MKRFHLELILIIAFILVVAVVPLIYMGDDTIDKLTCSPADSSMCAGWAEEKENRKQQATTISKS